MIHEKLLAVQAALKAPKGQTNAFGKYKYRSCEDILEALKPLLKEQGLVLTLSDSIENIGTRFYVRATATISCPHELPLNTRDKDYLSVSAYAREEEDKKGMDGAQITGSASSYARKYALNGLFCIDDTKDADATNDHGKAPQKVEKPKPDELVKLKTDIFSFCGGNLDEVRKRSKEVGIEAPEQMTLVQAKKLMNHLLDSAQ